MPAFMICQPKRSKIILLHTCLQTSCNASLGNRLYHFHNSYSSLDFPNDACRECSPQLRLQREQVLPSTQHAHLNESVQKQLTTNSSSSSLSLKASSRGVAYEAMILLRTVEHDQPLSSAPVSLPTWPQCGSSSTRVF
jgi:hypothetical protein